jgi:tetratricopeptide (TPR) repeat protein
MRLSHGRLKGNGVAARPRPARSAPGFAAVPGVLLAVLCLASPAATQDRPAGPGAAGSAGVHGARVEAGIVQLPNAGTVPVTPAAAPRDLKDLAAWIDYKLHGHVESLPYHARLFYRRGLLAHQSGNEEEALRLVHGAAELDPSYAAPHLKLASWLLTRSPSQALLHYAIVLDLARRNFLMQIGLAANSIYLALQAVLLALIAAGLLIICMHQAELRHTWSDRLVQRLSPITVRWWSWGLLALPFLLGLGPVLPTVTFLALLWPVLKRNERFVFVMLALFLATAPLTISALDTLAAPLRTGSAPYYGATMLEHAPYRASAHARLRDLAEAHPDNGFVQFALGWTARRGGAIAEAEAAYRRALVRWPDQDGILNNLGTTLALQGRTDEALEAYERATRINAKNAAAHYNRAQLKTLQFDFREASDGLSRASALDFDLVKNYQAQQTDDGYLPLIEQWLAPQMFWSAMPPVWLGAVEAPSLPPLWRSRIEFSGWPFSVAALVLTALALALGMRMHRAIPLGACSNCGAVVCRRCAERRRERALCPGCAALEARAESQEFGRVLLSQHRRRHEQLAHLVRTALATLVPGFGLLAFRRVAPALALFIAAAALGSIWLGSVGPFPYEPGLHLADTAIPAPVMIGLTILLYLCSLIGYFSNAARARAQAAYVAAPTRSRAAQATDRRPAAAA